LRWDRRTGSGTRDAAFLPAGPADPALAEALSENDDELLAELVEDEVDVPAMRLRRALIDQVRRSLIHPVFFGSAMTGAGVEAIQ
jgi:ribosomal protection tetracycline resistance protein